MNFRDKLTSGNYYQHILIILMIIFLVGASVKAQTKQEVYEYIKQIGIEQPNIVLSQSILETGHYECVNCSLDHNNLFGFRWKKQYLEFDTWQESCDYYLKWQTKWYKGQDYYKFLGCLWKHRDGTCTPYATSKDYINKLKKIKI